MSSEPDPPPKLPTVELPEGIDLTEGADFVLEFDDGTSLPARRCLLQIASPVLASLFTSVSQETSSLYLADDPSVWSALLCGLHPSGVQSFTKALSNYSLSQLNRIVALAHKYAIDLAVRWVDDIVSTRIQKRIEELMNARPSYWGSINDKAIDDYSLLQLMDWAARSGLDLSFEEALKLLECRVGHFASVSSRPVSDSAGSKISEMAEGLIVDGHTRYGLKIMSHVFGLLQIS